MDLSLGPDIDALRGFIENQQFGLGGQPAREGDLLLVAAGEIAGARVWRGRLDFQVVDIITYKRTFCGRAHPGSGKEPRKNAHGNVGGNGHFENHSMPTPVLGHVSDASVDGRSWRMDAEGVAAQLNLSRIGRRNAK